MLDSCKHGKKDKFSAKFHNSDKHPIDILQYDENWNEKIVKSKINPENEFTYETVYSQNFLFKRTNTEKRLKASSNGIVSDVFEGCRFDANPGRLVNVKISYGNGLNFLIIYRNFFPFFVYLT